jgi:hypothetical protein
MNSTRTLSRETISVLCYIGCILLHHKTLLVENLYLQEITASFSFLRLSSRRWTSTVVFLPAASQSDEIKSEDKEVNNH